MIAVRIKKVVPLARAEIADYLERYAAHFDLPVSTETGYFSPRAGPDT